MEMPREQWLRNERKSIRKMEKFIEQARSPYPARRAARWFITSVLFLFFGSVALCALTLNWPPVAHPGAVLLGSCLVSFSAFIKAALILRSRAPNLLRVSDFLDIIADKQARISREQEALDIELTMRREKSAIQGKKTTTKRL